MERGEYIEAIRLAESALARHPKQSIEAQLWGWIAIAKDALESPREEVEKWFQRAVALDPSNEDITHNYRLFRSRAES